MLYPMEKSPRSLLYNGLKSISLMILSIFLIKSLMEFFISINLVIFLFNISLYSSPDELFKSFKNPINSLIERALLSLPMVTNSFSIPS